MNNIEEVFNTYNKRLLQYVASKEFEAEDVCQETWLKYWEKSKVEEIENPWAYLKATAFNIIGNRICKSRAKKRILDSETINQFKEESYADDSETILPFIEEYLNKTEWEVLSMYLDGYTQKDIANHFNTTQPIVSKYLTSLKNKVKYIVQNFIN